MKGFKAPDEGKDESSNLHYNNDITLPERAILGPYRRSSLKHHCRIKISHDCSMENDGKQAYPPGEGRIDDVTINGLTVGLVVHGTATKVARKCVLEKKAKYPVFGLYVDS